MGEYIVAASKTRPSWQELARTHRHEQHSNIPKEWLISDELLNELGCKTSGVDLVTTKAIARTKLLSETELEITEAYTAVELLAKLADGHFTSLQVTTAFCKRAALAQQMTNCLTEIFFADALQRAAELDAHYKSAGSVKGPLHGLPISLKDAFIVSGKYATVGYTEFLRQSPPTQESALVSQLLDAGAVLYCKTNIPQTMMSADSENNVFGRTVNPRNIALTAGGSTGGEGALLALRGSPLGIGTDIAGSIRIPSLCCGTYGFKPTADRVPPSGQSESPFPRLWIPGGVPPVTGPMGNSVDDLEALMRIVSTQSPWKYDHAAIHAPWAASHLQISPRPLRIGVLPEDPEYTLHPPVRRALNEAAALLHGAGHTLIPLPDDPTRSIGLGARLAFYSYGIGAPSHHEFMAQLGEPLVTSIGRGVHPFINHPPLTTGTVDIGEKIHKLAVARDQYSDSWRRTWVQHDLDVVLAPGAQNTAVPHDQWGVPAYTCAWNVPDFPACIIPFGTASKERDPDVMYATAGFDPDYHPEVVDGAPCAVQIIAPRFHDELCLSAAKIVDGVLNPKKPANSSATPAA